MNYDITIGLEVHTQLDTNTKVWSSCEVSHHSLENTKVCEVTAAHPGTLPVLNEKVVEFAVMTGLATNCQIMNQSKFDRKNYFYPDLPKGYQITQLDQPIAKNGYIEITDSEGETRKIGIERIQIEEDTGKSTHHGEYSLINLNRAGTPLLEIVGKPELHTPEEASLYLRKLHAILVYLGVSVGNLQDGNFRCDANISLAPKGAKKLGTRTEVKNINSFRNVERAIEFEIKRHAELLDAGKKIIQQTLLFNADTGETHVLREKSDADDYRYFPEPDLLNLNISEEFIAKTKASLPELPDQKVARFVSDYNIPKYDAGVLTSDKALANYFEEAAKRYNGETKKVSNWIMVELLRYLNEADTPVEKSPVSPNELANMLNAIVDGTISGKMAKDVFQKMYDEKLTASAAIDALGLKQISDESELEAIAQKIIDNNQSQVQDYLNGKDRLFGFFVGQLMKETKGQANPGVANKIFKKLLK